jgi:hypothetical protein
MGAAFQGFRYAPPCVFLLGWEDPPANTAAANECDTNADTCCLGKNFVVLHATYRTADVYAYDTSIKPTDRVGGYGVRRPHTGDKYILVFNVLILNQLRAYGIPLWNNPFDPMHGLSVEVNPRFPHSRSHGRRITRLLTYPDDEPASVKSL